MKRIATFTAAVLLTSALAHAQGTPPTTKEHLKVLQPFVGEWVVDLTAKQDWLDGTIKKGDQFEMHLTYSWLFDNTGMSLALSSKKSSEDHRPIYSALIGWNAEAKDIVANGIFSRGAITTNSMKQDGRKWSIHRKTLSPDGSQSLSVIYVTFVDKNTMKTQIVGQDEEPNDDDIMTWKRK